MMDLVSRKEVKDVSSRYIDADALIQELKSIQATFGSGNGLIEGGLGLAISTANGQPTADVVEVVRCKDCEHRFKNKWFCCDGRCLDDDNYCSYGERREDER